MESHNRSSEEIDLAYFFNPLLKGLKKIGIAIGKYFLKLQRNLFLFIMIFLSIAAAGYSYRYFLPKLYATDAVFVSHNLSAAFCSEMIKNLKDLLGNKKNASALADQLNITKEAAASIRALVIVPMDRGRFLDTEDTSASTFKIRLIVQQESFIPDIQKGLENFLENNGFALKRREAKRKTLEDLRDDLLTRISNLDSLKNVLSRSVVPRSNGQGIILGEPVSPIQAYQVQRDYYSQLKEIEEKLALLKNVDIVQPFLRLNATNYPNPQKYFSYGLLLGLIAALLLTPLLGWRK